MTPRRIAIAVILVVFLALILCACGYPRHIDPPVHTFANSQLALSAAHDHANSIGGNLYVIADTHSMEPVLVAEDYVVVDKFREFSSVKLGEIVVYHADWRDTSEPPVVHRALVRDEYGFLVGGDNVDGRHSENKTRVTEGNYVGVVVGIYRVK